MFLGSEEGGTVPAVAARESISKALISHVIPAKGADVEWTASQLAEELASYRTTASYAIAKVQPHQELHDGCSYRSLPRRLTDEGVQSSETALATAPLYYYLGLNHVRKIGSRDATTEATSRRRHRERHRKRKH